MANSIIGRVSALHDIKIDDDHITDVIQGHPTILPDDVQEVVSHWSAILGSAGNPMKIYLKDAIPSLGGDNRLMLVLEDGVASDYFTQHPQNREQLQNLIGGYIGKEIEVDIQVARDRQEAEENYYDLRRGIPGVNMEIEEEE
jgi:DNA polymerase-3 subunit gamma/tau